MVEGSLLEPWPWWLGGLGLGLAAVAHLFLLGRPIGVSGSFVRLLRIKREVALTDAAMRRSLVAETVAEMRAAGVPEEEVLALERSSEPSPPAAASALVWSPVVFLAAIPLGALASAALSGQWGVSWVPAGLQATLLGRQGGLVACLLGGVLVGVGTRLSGGCTSGHGLSGCGRLQRPSLVATAIFFATGAITSLALAAWLR